MASKSGMGYTRLDLPLLIKKAHTLCFPPPFPNVASAGWLLEGGIGSSLWKTKNSGKEYYDKYWRRASIANFDYKLPNSTSLIDPVNKPCLDSLQMWSFAFRSGWLGADPSPKYWNQTTRWVMHLTSWMYLEESQFYPQEYGYGLLEEGDLKSLFEQLTENGWVAALKMIERSFQALFFLCYGILPDTGLVSELPVVPENIVKDITDALQIKSLFVKTETKSQRLISRLYLSEQLGVSVSMFNNYSIRKFLRQFEVEPGSTFLLVPGITSSQFPKSSLQKDRTQLVPEAPSKEAMLMHATYCMSFLAGAKMPSIGVPHTNFGHHSINELKSSWGTAVHRELIPVKDSLSVLNEAACWITEYGDDLISFYDYFMRARADFLKKQEAYGYTHDYSLTLFNKKYAGIRSQWLRDKISTNSESSVIESLGLQKPVSQVRRNIDPNELSLMQAIFALVGACAYAIGMMKPLRDGELASIQFDCVLRHNKTNGAWVTFPNEKGQKQSLLRYVDRPIPYLTYLAIKLMQRLARVTSSFFSESVTPPRLFYFCSGDGFMPPVDDRISVGINRCMDIFVDCVNLPLNEDGSRHYFRVHELRKFFLLLLSWEDRQHGFECGAWMAAHRDENYIRAYTDANLKGLEISDWEAEQVEIKLLALETDGSGDSSDDLQSLYKQLKVDLCVEKIAGLSSEHFSSWVRNALASGRYSVRFMILSMVDGSADYNLGVFMKETKQ